MNGAGEPKELQERTMKDSSTVGKCEAVRGARAPAGRAHRLRGEMAPRLGRRRRGDRVAHAGARDRDGPVCPMKLEYHGLMDCGRRREWGWMTVRALVTLAATLAWSSCSGSSNPAGVLNTGGTAGSGAAGSAAGAAGSAAGAGGAAGGGGASGNGGGSAGNGAAAGHGGAGGGGSGGIPDCDESCCGNGALDPGEQCDEGQYKSFPGCTALCQIEQGWSCPTPGKPCVFNSVCGNGIVEGFEQCDDGNTTSGDGCSSTCQLEVGWSCPTAGAACIGACAVSAKCGVAGSTNVCGDGIVSSGEQCDCGDGTVAVPAGCPGPNGSTYGGCTTSCTFGAYCGDGIVQAPEACDPGQGALAVYGADGCTASCQRPIHYCGDGQVDADEGEQCDLGPQNGALCSGCNASCKIDINLDPTECP